MKVGGTTLGAIEHRGVLECFYGELWSDQERRSMLELLVEEHGNLYVYGPSADARTGHGWREPYAPAARTRLAEFAEAAGNLGVNLVYRVSPSSPLDRRYAISLGDDDESARLHRLCRDVIAIGARYVLIAFDDIDASMDAAAVARFGHTRHPLAAAQAAVLNRARTVIEAAGAQLLVCPTQYWGVEPSLYRAILGELLADGVPVWWTGPAVCSPTITAAGGAAVAEQYGHPLWLWDNYPVNDWDCHTLAATGAVGLSNEINPRRALVDPLDGREPTLSGVLAGYAANGGSSAAQSRLAIRTALTWARDPAQYNPALTLVQACDQEGVPTAAFDLVRPHLGPSPVSDGVPLLVRIVSRLLCTDRPETTAEEERQLMELLAAVTELQHVDGSPTSAALDPWLDELRWSVTTASLAAAALTSRSRGDHHQSGELMAELQSLERPSPQRRPVVASGITNALVERARGATGPVSPPWPDSEVLR